MPPTPATSRALWPQSHRPICASEIASTPVSYVVSATAAPACGMPYGSPLEGVSSPRRRRLSQESASSGYRACSWIVRQQRRKPISPSSSSRNQSARCPSVGVRRVASTEVSPEPGCWLIDLPPPVGELSRPRHNAELNVELTFLSRGGALYTSITYFDLFFC